MFLRAAIVRALEQLEESLMVLEQALETQPDGLLAPRLRSTVVAVQALATQVGP